MDNRPIGIFDSGIGGLTVVKELMRQLPQESIVYFGDTARLPYGSKSIEVIQRFSVEILNFLLAQDVKAIVIACNTASAAALDLLKSLSPVPVYGVIKAGVNATLKKTQNKRVGVIGTKTTIQTSTHKKIFYSQDPEIQVFSQSCPLFVPLIEEGWINSPITDQVIEKYLSPLKAKKIDTLILGCTHYPLLKERIGCFFSSKVTIVNPAAELIKEIKKDLILSNQTNDKPTYEFFVSDVPNDFLRVSDVFLTIDTLCVKQIDLEEQKLMIQSPFTNHSLSKLIQQ
tara:strand:- start:134 stop:988 length:855 start_codon:yes stop_codon:yes gene_type:complete